MTTTCLSLCSGVGGMDLGLQRAGISIVGHCEIDPTARTILARHWPNVPCHDDITTLNGHDWHGRVDLVCGGTPCTDLSMAGRREGLGGEHSRLFWDFCRIVTDSAARWVLWENVAGALSSQRGADFASVLWGLTGHLPAVPADGWGSVGVCVGVDRAAVWRLFDARWFGVAQRRRRVFVVGCPVADIGRAIEVLLEPESLRGDSQPGSEAGSHVAALTANSVGTCGADDNQAQAGHLIATSLHHTQNPITATELCHTLSMVGAAVFQGSPAALTTRGRADMAVRRLLPVECERLMGYPDDWTRFAADGREIADSHRYKACGNGVVTPQAEWIGRRLVAAITTSTQALGAAA